jgi:ABC-2 type transport system ATP-binding protein
VNDSILEISNLIKKFGDVTAVNNVNLRVCKGQVFGFLGPNGAGKTTTIGMILGLIHPSNGRIELFGELISPSQTRPLQKVGALVGHPSLIPYLSGRENLRLVAKLSAETSGEQIDEVLELVSMTEAANRTVKGYSTGMKQRIGLASALMHKPDLVILDEPTNGLDPAGMREIRQIILNLAQNGTTVFLSSHLLHEVEQVCDEIAVLNKGQIVAQGSVAELLSQSEETDLESLFLSYTQ